MIPTRNPRMLHFVQGTHVLGMGPTETLHCPPNTVLTDHGVLVTHASGEQQLFPWPNISQISWAAEQVTTLAPVKKKNVK